MIRAVEPDKVINGLAVAKARVLDDVDAAGRQARPQLLDQPLPGQLIGCDDHQEGKCLQEGAAPDHLIPGAAAPQAHRVDLDGGDLHHVVAEPEPLGELRVHQPGLEDQMLRGQLHSGFKFHPRHLPLWRGPVQHQPPWGRDRPPSSVR